LGTLQFQLEEICRGRSAKSPKRSSRTEYYAEDGRAIVLYFLGNAKSWRGETARRIKTELKNILEESK